MGCVSYVVGFETLSWVNGSRRQQHKFVQKVRFSHSAVFSLLPINYKRDFFFFFGKQAFCWRALGLSHLFAVPIVSCCSYEHALQLTQLSALRQSENVQVRTMHPAIGGPHPFFLGHISPAWNKRGTLLYR